jgi:REP element-mobilizing transposase RayT
MPYKPNLHHRRSIRLKGYDYSQAGLYFITICCQDRICRFGKIENGEMILNEYGQIAYNEWAKLSKRYPYISNDVFQIMPNHVHGIIVLDDAVARNTTVGNIIGAYKSLVMNECLKIYKSRNDFMGKVWQRNFYEHIIRNEQSYQNVSDYIIHNPENWAEDKFYITGM